MDEIENHLKKIVYPMSAQKGSLSVAIKGLDQIVHKSSDELHPKLKHFLQNRSYEKALVWLNNGDPEKGTCGK